MSDEAEERPPFIPLTERIESNEALDHVVGTVDKIAGLVSTPRWQGLLRGNWLGHAFHPLLTDLALGLWLGAGMLDLAGGKRDRNAARSLVGWGVVAAAPTLATGLSEWTTLATPAIRRVAAVHGLGNVAVTLAYLSSWWLRRRGRNLAGIAWGMTGGSLAWVTGYLGGHLSFGRQAGTGLRI